MTENCKHSKVRKKPESYLTFVLLSNCHNSNILSRKSNGHEMFCIAKMSQLITTWIKAFKQIFGCLPHSFHFHLLVAKPINISAAILFKKQHLQFPNNCKRYNSYRYRRSGEQRCSDSVSKTCGRRVVDLQPIQNGFLHFSSVCFSPSVYFLVHFCLFTCLVWFALNLWARKKTFKAYS